MLNLLVSAALELPHTGGDGPLLVTVIGISLAVVSLIILFVRMRSGQKEKDKAKNQQQNGVRHTPPPGGPTGGGPIRR